MKMTMSTITKYLACHSVKDFMIQFDLNLKRNPNVIMFVVIDSLAENRENIERVIARKGCNIFRHN